MGDVLVILRVPITIAVMSVAFVLTLGAAGGASAVEPVGMGHPGSGARDD